MQAGAHSTEEGLAVLSEALGHVFLVAVTTFTSPHPGIRLWSVQDSRLLLVKHLWIPSQKATQDRL